MGGRGTSSGVGTGATQTTRSGRRNLIGARTGARTPIIRNTRNTAASATQQGGGITAMTGVSVSRTASTAAIPERNQRIARRRKRIKKG